MKIHVLYSGKPSYKRILLREVSWLLSHPRNLKLWVKPNLKSCKYWFWNINVLFFGLTKCNGEFSFRFLNWKLEIGY